MRRALAVLAVAGCVIGSGCYRQQHYALPLRANPARADAEACYARCAQRSAGARAACLRRCPGAYESERCPRDYLPPAGACASRSELELGRTLGYALPLGWLGLFVGAVVAGGGSI